MKKIVTLLGIGLITVSAWCQREAISISETEEIVTDGIEVSPPTSITEINTPGPVTGFEGHNFVEHPAIIYPNPVHDIMQVKSTDPITVIEILNLNGQLIKSFVVDELLTVKDLAAGNYYVRIHFENIPNVQIEKIMIMN